LIRLQEAKHGRKLGIRVIVDFEGISSDHFSTALMKVHNILMKTLQDMFPDALNQLYGINAHPLVKTAFTMMKPMIPEKTRKKIVILDGEYQQRLAADIGPENVFPRWGGTKRASKGHPEWGTLRQGGMPPDHLRLANSAFWAFLWPIFGNNFGVYCFFGNLYFSFQNSDTPPQIPIICRMKNSRN
jgi:hypothetical protein